MRPIMFTALLALSGCNDPELLSSQETIPHYDVSSDPNGRTILDTSTLPLVVDMGILGDTLVRDDCTEPGNQDHPECQDLGVDMAVDAALEPDVTRCSVTPGNCYALFNVDGQNIAVAGSSDHLGLYEIGGSLRLCTLDVLEGHGVFGNTIGDHPRARVYDISRCLDSGSGFDNLCEDPLISDGNRTVIAQAYDQFLVSDTSGDQIPSDHILYVACEEQ